MIKPTSKDFFEGSNHYRNFLTFNAVLETKDINCQFLYESDGLLYMADEKTFEEHTIPTSRISQNMLKLLEGLQI